MKQVLRLTLLVVGGAVLFAGALAIDYRNQVRVESRDGRYNAVRVRTGGDVRIVRRLSDSGCRLGRSWGFDANTIWVDDGCRAIFEYGYDRRGDRRDDRWDDRRDRRDGRWDDWNRPGPWRRIRVESRDDRRSYVRIPNNGVNLLRQLSDSPCREGRTWGHDWNGVWVDNGCRAEFEVRLR